MFCAYDCFGWIDILLEMTIYMGMAGFMAASNDVFGGAIFYVVVSYRVF